jgi:hypothetical protein
MPTHHELRAHFSAHLKEELKGRSFASEQDLRTFLSTATFDGGRLHRYVETWSAEGTGTVTNLQACIEKTPETLLACLRSLARMERSEKRALKSYVHTARPAEEAPELLQALEAVPEIPTFLDVPRFTLPGW